MVTRKDLTEGQRAVQSAHAAINFTFEHPDRAGPWWKDSNYLVLLEVENEDKLKDLIYKLNELNLRHAIFKEPDLDNKITAVAIEPSELTQKIVKKIPLLFKERTN